MAAYDGTMDHIQAMNRALTGRRDLSHRRLNEIEGLSASRPQAAFFIFPNVEATGTVWKGDYEFASDLKAEARIAVNPGSNYGDRNSHGHFRVPYLPGEDVLEGIYDKLECFMKKKVC
jgi:aspartate/methionine/tyrosine aminotransferase